MGLLDELNAPQREAVVTTEGPLLVLAGAGSGKTRVLTHRIAHILERRLAAPWQILAVTFTNKAAREMRARLERLVGPAIGDAWIGTFHATCARLLRRDGERLGFTRSFTIYDTDDAERTMRRLLEKGGVDIKRVPPAAVMSVIDRGKNEGLFPKAFAEKHGKAFDPFTKTAVAFYGRYQDALAAANAMDFGDLLLYSVALLRDHPEVRERLRARFRYLLVDEFQDTNAVQLELLERLLGEHRNLMVVGDDDQSIYRWRGAEVRNILEFPRRFPDAKVVTLEENYRSTRAILGAANAVIAKNPERHPKRLFTSQAGGEKVGVALFERGDEEAIAIAEILARRLRGGERPEDFAILYRMNAQSRLFEEALRRARVPYVVIGGTAFFDRREVKDVLAYLRLLVNPKSQGDLERILNVPPRKLGKTTLERLRAAAEASGRVGLDVLELPAETLEAHGIARGAISALGQLAATLRELGARAEAEPATEVTKRLLDRVGYLGYIENADVDGPDRVQNVEELVSTIADFEESLGEGVDGEDRPGSALGAFLESAALTASSDKEGEASKVSLLTVHAAKGLEFPVVFVVGLEEGTFPSRRSIDDGPEQLAEERRLCYVAFTRAMRELHLSAASMRRTFGSVEAHRPSRFLADLPDQVVTGFGRGRPAPARVEAAERFETVERAWPDERRSGREARGAADEVVTRRVEASEPAAGQTVAHNTFGRGVVEAVDRDGSRTLLTIRFPEHGTKRIVSRFVELVDPAR